MSTRYTKTAVILHWLIAIAIISQIIMGLWMVEAIDEPASKALAFKVYQLHKSIGLTVLWLVVLRLIWRIFHRPPALPKSMARWEVFAAHLAHYCLYLLALVIPLLGWAMVSVNPYGLTTMYFNFFQWPDITWLANSPNKDSYFDFFKEAHEFSANIIILFIAIHVLAGLKHHFIDKDDILIRMLPFLSKKNKDI